MSAVASAGPQIIEHCSKSVGFTPYGVQWIPASARFVLVGQTTKGSGLLQVYEMEEGKLKVTAESAQKTGLKCCTFGASAYEKRHLATGGYDGALSVWDLEKLETPLFQAPTAHASIIHCMDGVGGLNIGGGAPELVTGGRDGCVRVWDVRQSTPVAALEPAADEKARDCWAVAFGHSYNDTERMVVAGYETGDLKFFDLRFNRLLYETNLKSGIVSVEFDRKDIAMNKLLVTTLESRFRVFDLKTQHPESGFAYLVEKAHKSTVWLGKHLPQNREVFMTLGGNGTANLYKYHYPAQRSVKDLDSKERGVIGRVELLNTQQLSTQPVVSFDWHADKAGLCVMSSLDQYVKVAIVTKLNKL